MEQYNRHVDHMVPYKDIFTIWDHTIYLFALWDHAIDMFTLWDHTIDMFTLWDHAIYMFTVWDHNESLLSALSSSIVRKCGLVPE